MNPLTNVRNLAKINERELASGTAGDDRRSWHAKYKDSAWIFVGGLPYELSEGDIICIFSQYGEIVNVNLIRDKKTGKSRGFAFVCYEDQRSTVLAVDNFNATKVLGRTLRVDHVEQYRVPKDREDVDEETRRIWMEGCAPNVSETKPPIDNRSESEKRQSDDDRRRRDEKDDSRRDSQSDDYRMVEKPEKRRLDEKDDSRSEKRRRDDDDHRSKKHQRHDDDDDRKRRHREEERHEKRHKKHRY